MNPRIPIATARMRGFTLHAIGAKIAIWFAFFPPWGRCG